MAYQFTTVKEDLLLGGIDARSAESQIRPGFVRDALNADLVQGYARKRTGYVGHAGNLPVRVLSVDSDDTANANQICFTLDPSHIDLLSIRSTPVVIHGLLSGSNNMGAGTFNSSTSTTRYYPGFIQTIRKTFLTGTNTLVIPGAEHNLGTGNIFVGVSRSLSPVTLDNELVDTDSISINQTTFDISIGYTNNTGNAFDVFVYYLDRDAVPGSIYVTDAAPLAAIPASSTVTRSVPAGTHQLSNYNIIVRTFVDDGTSYTEIMPDQVVISSSSGNVDITITNNTISPFNIVAVLDAVPGTQALSDSVAVGSNVITLTNVTSPFVITGIYLDNGVAKSMVHADSITYESAFGNIVVEFQNNTLNAINFQVCWEYASIRSNQFCVTDTLVTTSLTDTLPQLTVWGLDHAEIYGSSKEGREGWSNYLDSYRSAGGSRILAGIGGNIFGAYTAAEAGIEYLYGSAFPNLNSRILATANLAPVFQLTGTDTGIRSRGIITGTGLSDNWATVTAISWDSVSFGGSVKCIATIPGAAASGVLSTIISSDTDLEDYLTLQDMSYSLHNGTFRILGADLTGTTLSIWVSNPAIFTADFDDSGLSGRMGIFTDRITFTPVAPFIAGDVLLSNAIPESSLITVLSSLATQSVVSGISEPLALAVGIQLVGQRTSSVMPLRDSNGDATVVDFVRGDMLQLSGVTRQLRILYVDVGSDTGVNIAGDGATAVVQMSSGNTDRFSIGQAVLFVRSGIFSGEHIITNIVSTDIFEFESTLAGAANGEIQGGTVHLSESLEWQDSEDESIVAVVAARFIPIEAPLDTMAETPSTRYRHFSTSDYGDQQFLRSSMISDNMYISNNEDSVQKFDGTNLYRAGLVNWQPGVFIKQDTAATNKIVLPQNLSSIPSAVSGSKFTIPVGEEAHFPVGSTLMYTNMPATYDGPLVVAKAWSTAANGFIEVTNTNNLPPSGALVGTPLLKRMCTYKYYYRLNAVDANNNIIASAISQSQDHSIQLADNAAVYHKLVGMPPFDSYDFDRIYLQVYRTKADAFSVYYRLPEQKQVVLNASTSYIEYIDTFIDENLIDLDPTSSLKAGELGIGWQEPLRAKCVTATAGSLVLGNVRDYPQLDIQFQGPGSTPRAFAVGSRYLFKRDSLDTDTVSNMINRQAYEFRNGGSYTAVTAITGTAGTSFTATIGAHTLVTGDWVYLYHTTPSSVSTQLLTYSGWWRVASAGATTITVNYAGATAGAAGAGSFPSRLVTATMPTDIPVLLEDDANYGNVTGNNIALAIYNAARRLALAINCSMRVYGAGLPADFTPWMYARGGNDTGVSGKLQVRFPVVGVSSPSVVLSGTISYDIFVNDIKRVTGNEVEAQTHIFPSRLLVSYENFPEIFDSPTEVQDTDSDSAIDVNPSDGQEITSVVPFFGEAAFGAAQQSSVLVVLKEQSIYLVDLAQKRAGNNAVQRIETEGIGCTAPYSVSVTKGGIIFANESGIYVLRRNLAIEYLGKWMERNWLQLVNRELLNQVQGHHFTIGRQYKISLPMIASSDDNNSDVYVYDHSAELTGEGANGQAGAWTRYDSHPATGWCNLQRDAYFCSSAGRVFRIRRDGDQYDYQDDASPISFRLRLRPNDFGISGIRKILDSIVVQYRTETTSLNTELNTSVDTSSEFTPTTPFEVKPSRTSDTGMSDSITQDIATILHSARRRRGVQFALEFTNSTVYESVQITNIEYKVATVGKGQGVTEAADTTRSN